MQENLLDNKKGGAMKNKSIILLGIILCSVLLGCNTKINISNEIQDNNKLGESNSKVEECEEQKPVMSKMSIQCIENALGENSDKGEGIAEFLSSISIGEIVRAEMIKGELYEFTNFLEVEDDLGEVYIVVLTAKYYPDSIIEDSMDGEWIFGVAE